MRIRCYDFRPWQEWRVREALAEHDVIVTSEPLSSENLADADVLITRPRRLKLRFTKEVLARLPSLKLLATISTGHDHIDLAACKEREVIVAHVPGYGATCVAEHAFALLLGLAKELPRAMSGESPEGVELAGKTLGVIGAGAIGRRVLRIGKAFGMRCLAYDIITDEEAARRTGYEYAPREEILAESDAISLHAPLASENKHLLDEKAFALMKKGVLIVNTSRGELIKTRALLDAIAEGKVRGAGLDVWEEGFEEELRGSPRIILTPHNGSNTREAQERILDRTIRNVKAFLAGAPENVVA